MLTEGGIGNVLIVDGVKEKEVVVLVELDLSFSKGK